MQKIALLVFFLLLITAGYGQSITITSVTSTQSTCAANGTVTAKVSVTPPSETTLVSVSYTLIPDDPSYPSKGPENNSTDYTTYTFTGVRGGTGISYKVEAVALFSDASTLTSARRSVSVSGTYVEPVAVASVYVPSLVNCDTTGIAYVRVSGGKTPATVTIIDYAGTSPLGTAQIGSSTSTPKTTTTNYRDYYFYSLPSGTYTFRAVDDCLGSSITTVEIETFDISSYITSTYSWYTSCRLYIYPYVNVGSSIEYYSNINTHYSKHPKISYKIESTTAGYTGPTRYLPARDTVPEIYTKNQTFPSYTITVHDPCGNELSKRTLGATNNTSPLLYSQAYYANPEACNQLSLYFSHSYTNYTSYRITFNGSTSPFMPMPSTSGRLHFETGFNNYKELFAANAISGSIELVNNCGESITQNFSVQQPSTTGSWIYNCGTVTTPYVNNNYYGVICLPAKFVLTSIANPANVYEIPASARGVPYTRDNVPAGDYKIELVGSDDYRKVLYTTYTFGEKRPTLNSTYSTCIPDAGYFSFSSGQIPNNTRIVLFNSPNPLYYYDVSTTNSATSYYYIYPDGNKVSNANGYGVPGDYTFLLYYPACAIPDTVKGKISSYYSVSSFDVTIGGETCKGIPATPTGQIVSISGATSTNLSTYFQVSSAPTGYVISTPNKKVGDTIYLTLPGRYIFGITTSSTSNSCHLRYDTINIASAGAGVDMMRSLAFICPERTDNEGRIYAQGKGGVPPYTYYLSNVGTGGPEIITGGYIAKNTTGAFDDYNLIRSTIYDITVQDSCGNTATQPFTVGDLQDVNLAFTETPITCKGSTIKFKAMGLPNPTYKWYKPGAATYFSESQTPEVPNAQFSDGGTYRVDITTSLCVATTITKYVEVEVVEPGFITRSGGDASQTICAGSAVEDIVYTWGGSATDITITGLTSTYYLKDDISKTLTIRGTMTTAGTYTYTISTVGACNETTVTGSIIRKAKPSMSPSTATNKGFCVNEAITPFTYTMSGTTNTLSVTGLPTGLSTSVSGSVLTISGTPLVNGIYTYTVTAATTDPSNPCDAVTSTGTIIVDNGDELTLVSGSTNTTVCYSSSYSNIAVFSFGGTALGVTVTAPSSSYYTIDNTAKTVTIRKPNIVAGSIVSYTITTTGGCNPIVLNGTFEVIALPTNPTITFEPICLGDYAKIKLATTVIGNKYEIYDASSGGTKIGEADGTGNELIITTSYIPTSTSSNVYYYIQTINQYGCSSSRTSTYGRPTILPAAPSLSGTPAEICAGEEAFFKQLSSSTYRYHIYTTAIGGTPIYTYNGTGSTMTVSVGTVSATTTFYVESEIISTGCLSATRLAVFITAKPYVTASLITVIPDPDSICKNTRTTFTASVSNTIISPQYKWYSDNTSTATVLASTATYTTPNLSNNATYYVSIKGTNYCENEVGNRKAVDVIIRPTIKYTDIRIPVCPQTGSIDLKRYITPTDLVSINYSSSFGLSISDGVLDVSSLPYGSYPILYSVNNTCSSNQKAKIYVDVKSTIATNKLPSKLLFCHLFAEDIYLNPMLGISGGQWILGAASPYVTTLANGVLSFDGKSYYEDQSVSNPMPSPKAYNVHLRYVIPASNSCLGIEEVYPLELVITEEL